MGVLRTFLIAILCQQVLSAHHSRRPTGFQPIVRNGFQPADLENGLQINDQKSIPVSKCLLNVLKDPIIRQLLEQLNYCSLSSSLEHKTPTTGENWHAIPTRASEIPTDPKPKSAGSSGSAHGRINSAGSPEESSSSESESNSLEHTSPWNVRFQRPGSKPARSWEDSDSEEESAESTPNPWKYHVPKVVALESDESSEELGYRPPKEGKNPSRIWKESNFADESAEPTQSPWKYQVPKIMTLESKIKKPSRKWEDSDSEEESAEPTLSPWKYQVPKIMTLESRLESKINKPSRKWEDSDSEEESAEPTRMPWKYPVPKIIPWESEVSRKSGIIEESQSESEYEESSEEKDDTSSSSSSSESEENEWNPPKTLSGNPKYYKPREREGGLVFEGKRKVPEEVVILKPKPKGPGSSAEPRIGSGISNERTTIAPEIHPTIFTEKEIIHEGHPEKPVYPVEHLEEPRMDIKKELEELVEHGNDENDPDCAPLVQAIREQLQNLKFKQELSKITINTSPISRSWFDEYDKMNMRVPSMGRKSQRNGEFGSGYKTLEAKLPSLRYQKGGRITQRLMRPPGGITSLEYIPEIKHPKQQPGGLRLRKLIKNMSFGEYPGFWAEPEAKKSVHFDEEIPEEKKTIRGHRSRKMKSMTLFPEIVPEARMTVVPGHFQERPYHHYVNPALDKYTLEKYTKQFQGPEERFFSGMPPPGLWEAMRESERRQEEERRQKEERERNKEESGNIGNNFQKEKSGNKFLKEKIGNSPPPKNTKPFQVPKA